MTPEENLAYRARCAPLVDLGGPIEPEIDLWRYARQGLFYLILAICTSQAGFAVQEFAKTYSLRTDGLSRAEVSRHPSIVNHPYKGPRQIASWDGTRWFSRSASNLVYDITH